MNAKSFVFLSAAELILINLSFIARIFLFYLIFYAALAAFFVAMWLIFASSLLDGRPKYELKESIIGTNPGLGFRPMPPESNVESTLIWYQKKNSKNSQYWIEEIERFLGGKYLTVVSSKLILMNFCIQNSSQRITRLVSIAKTSNQS